MLLRNFSRKSHKTSLEDLQDAGVKISEITPEQRHLFDLLHRWRERYSKITDSDPYNLLRTQTLWSLALAGTKSIVHEVTLPDRGIPASILQRQSKTIALILHERDPGIFQKMAECKCHNCRKLGHAANICPYPKDPRAARIWERENPEDQKKQKLRRRLKYKESVRARKLAAVDSGKEAVPVRPQSSSLTLTGPGFLPNVNRRINVPGRIVGALLGRNGLRIQGYETQSGARIHILREGEFLIVKN